MPPDVIGGRLLGGLRSCSCSVGFAIWHTPVFFKLNPLRRGIAILNPQRRCIAIINSYRRSIPIFGALWIYAVYF